MFYLKLALTNLKKNGKTYFPYLLTCILTVMMFYVMYAIGKNEGLDTIEGSGYLKTILSYAAWITGFFAAVFLFYTNSFLIKQRKKELGLYQVMGMDKRNLAKMLLCESLLTAGCSLAAGLILGLLLGKLMFLILLKMLHFPVDFVFSAEPEALLKTSVFFLAVFLVIFFWNLVQVWRAAPVELLHGTSQGEKEPKTKWLMTLLGIAAMGGGYFIALTTESPLSAIEKFFFAVLLVVIGTYALFLAGSIALLKLLKKNKKFYYKARHFTSVSGMIYRMKQNAAGLANICIMSTVALVLISVTVSLYSGMENILRTRFPAEMHVAVERSDDVSAAQLEQLLTEELQNEHVEMTDHFTYRSGSLAAILDGSRLILSEEEGEETALGSLSYAADQYRWLHLIPLSDYNEMEGKQTELAEGEALIYIPRGDFRDNTITLQDQTYQVKEALDTIKVEKRETGFVVSNVYVILPDEESILELLAKYGEGNTGICYSVYFNLEGEKDACARAVTAIQKRIPEIAGAWMEYREAYRQEFYAMYGGFLFLGVFVGALFLVGTVLIIYYKQISEGYDDRERYQIMQQIGMAGQEVKRSIRSQVLLVFFLPLLVAALHVAVAFKPISKLLAALYLVNVRLEIFCTCGTVLIFALFYIIVYGLTSREYYRIVR